VLDYGFQQAQRKKVIMGWLWCVIAVVLLLIDRVAAGRSEGSAQSSGVRWPFCSRPVD